MNEETLYNTTAEASVLSAIFIDNTLISELQLAGCDFYHEANRIIYSAMVELYFFNEKVDLITVQQKLVDKKKLDDVGGIGYLMQINSATFTTVGCVDHANIIRDLALKRELLRYVAETQCYVKDSDMKVDDIVDDLLKKVGLLTMAKKDYTPQVDIANEWKDFIEKLEFKAVNNIGGLQTHLLDFDRVTGGLYKPDLIVLAARPGMGKTALALTIARNIVYKNKQSVMFISMEMSSEQLQSRLLSSLTGIELIKFRKPNTITEEEWVRLKRAKEWRTDGYLEVYDNTSASVADIQHKARQIQHEHGLDLVIVDYIQLMEDKDSNKGNRENEVSKISRALKKMAMELQVPVLALSQLNRGLESRQDKRPLLSDLRESGSIEQDADMVLFVYRDNYYNENSADQHTELIISKHRNGDRCTIPLYFDAKTTTFKNLSKNQGGY